jgi:hypothetical protein
MSEDLPCFSMITTEFPSQIKVDLKQVLHEEHFCWCLCYNIASALDFLQGKGGVLYADLDMADCIEGEQYHDIVGRYERFDVFEFKVDRRRRESAIFLDGEKIKEGVLK